MKKYIFILFSVAVLTSCKEYLDIKPYGKEIPETAEDFSALLHKVCNDLDLGNSVAIGSVSRSSYFEEIADNSEVNLTEYPGGTTLNSYVGVKLSSQQSQYKNFYSLISICNMVLDAFPDGGNTRDELDVIGTAYAFRAACYYQLMREFCAPPLAEDGKLGVPIVTEFDMEAKPIRSTMQETIERIEKDLRKAIECDVQNELFRLNSEVCYGFLARLYHWCGRWSEARAIALELLQRHPLISGEDYVNMISKQYGLQGNVLIKGDLLINTTSDLESHYTTWSFRPLSTRFVQLFTEGSRDVRYALSFNARRRNQKKIFANLRAAEFALIAMEAAYHMGDEATALQELNDFRRLRITGYTDLTTATLPDIRDDEYIKEDCYGRPLTKLLYAILVERRKEFYMENGDRWFELKRNGRPEWWIADKGLKYWTRKYMYTFPLPIEDIYLQPGLIQNPGYDEAIK